MKYEVGDKVTFVPENYEGAINSQDAIAYKSVIGKIGVVTEVSPRTSYPYRVSFTESLEPYHGMLFNEDELKYADVDISIELVEEHEDGSATYNFDIPKNFESYLISIGIKFALYCAAAGVTTKEALDYIEENFIKKD